MQSFATLFYVKIKWTTNSSQSLEGLNMINIKQTCKAMFATLGMSPRYGIALGHMLSRINILHKPVKALAL